MRTLWRDAGARDGLFGIKLAEAYNFQDKESVAADVLLEIIKTSEPSAAFFSRVVSRCIPMLDAANRGDETEGLIQQFKGKLASETDFVGSWARHAIRVNNRAAIGELAKLPALEKIRISLAATIYFRAGLVEKASTFADAILKEMERREASPRDLQELIGLFKEIDRFEEFEKKASENYPELDYPERRYRGRRGVVTS